MIHAIASTLLFVVFGLVPSLLVAQSWTPYSYDTGTPSVTDYYIDPSNGSDDNTGLSPSAAWRTVQHAWGQIPSGGTLTSGFRFNLANGTYGSDELPNYWELRTGTAQYPIIIQPVSGATSIVFSRDINMADVSYFYLLGINITPSPAGDAFHCERCDHILIRGCTLNGGSTSGGAHETVKVNQSQYIYLENNNIGGADDNAIDFVAVQYGHLIGNRVHDATDWCAYVKGGSAYLRIEGNSFYDCGTGGVTAGQGSGFQFMTSPWLHYEAYDIKIINNLVYRASGAAFGVNGGYNVLIAHNTAYSTGTRDHLVEVVFGERTCDGQTDGAADADCASRNAAGGWGSAAVKTTPDPVGNKNVAILNNLMVNPAGTVAPQHFAIYGPRTAASGTNFATTQRSDENLVISGNVIVNGDNSTLLGIEDPEQGCQSTNATCNEAQLRADNSINALTITFQNPSAGDLRPDAASASLLAQLTSATLTPFAGGDRPTPPTSDAGELTNSFTRDLSGTEFDSGRIAGAYGSATSSVTPPALGEVPTPDDPAGSVPSVATPRIKQARLGKRVSFTITATVTSDSTLSAVTASATSGATQLGSKTLRRKGDTATFTGKLTFKPGKKKRATVTVTATNETGASSKSRTVKIQ